MSTSNVSNSIHDGAPVQSHLGPNDDDSPTTDRYPTHSTDYLLTQEDNTGGVAQPGPPPQPVHSRPTTFFSFPPLSSTMSQRVESMPGALPEPRLQRPHFDSPIRCSSGSIYQRRRARPDGKLRIAIVCENIMPKVDGVTKCLARLLEHLRANGHECVVLGPESGMREYETHPLIGTAGIPLVLYPGLKLNFIRPLFLRTITAFDPDVIHVVDPIWLGAQVLWAMQLGWCGPEWVNGQKPIVASYHTNLPTYASLFGLSWLEPIMWKFIRTLHSKALLTACPSQSTADMLVSRGVKEVRIWPRGIDVSIFKPNKGNKALRARWTMAGSKSRRRATLPVSLDEEEERRKEGEVLMAKSLSLLPTPPPSPELGPVSDEPVVILYVGRVSHEKNLFFLLQSFSKLSKSLPKWMNPPRLVFVGDGPARPRLESAIQSLGIIEDHVIFEGHISDPKKLAECYASADLFAFPSFTETFGQVICEALASGLPVVGLDAPGTRDLVNPSSTGHLLPKPSLQSTEEWHSILSNEDSPTFSSLASSYASLLEDLILNRGKLIEMGKKACTEGVEGRTWNDAMECMVRCYREGVEMSENERERRKRVRRLGKLASVRAFVVLWVALVVFWCCRQVDAVGMIVSLSS